jgi:hypothetical protein
MRHESIVGLYEVGDPETMDPLDEVCCRRSPQHLTPSRPNPRDAWS